MSIASEITRLQGVKSDILTAISNKGVTVPAGSALDDCPELIGDIGNTDYLLKTDFSNFDVNNATDYPEVGSPAVLTDGILSFTKSNTSYVTGETVSSLIGTASSGNTPNNVYGYEVPCNEELTVEIVTKISTSTSGIALGFLWTAILGVADFAIMRDYVETIKNRFVITSSLNITPYNATLKDDVDGFKFYDLKIGSDNIFQKYTIHLDVHHNKVYIYCGDIILFVINNINISGTYRIAFDPRNTGSVECTSIIAYKGAPKFLNLYSYRVIGGKRYKTVVMPDGKEWLAENLDFKFCNLDSTTSANPSGEKPSACYYNNDESTYGWNGYKCGLLYNWYAVKLLNDNRSELCPGWHVPSQSEYSALKSAISPDAGYKLSKGGLSWTSQWTGSNEFGFSILPAGQLAIGLGFTYIGIQGVFRTIESNYYASVDSNSTDLDIGTISQYVGYHKYSLRLVRDT